MIRVAYSTRPIKRDAEALVVWLADSAAAPSALDMSLKRRVAQAIALKEFSGKAGQVTVLVPEGAGPRIVLVGLGKADAVTRESMRRAAGHAGKRLAAMALTEAAALVPELKGAREPDLKRGLGEVLAEGLILGAYTFTAYKTPAPEERDRPKLRRVTLHDPAHVTTAASVDAGAARGAGICLARDLGNHPSNTMTPTVLAQHARAVARKRGLRCTVLGRAEMERLGMGMLLGVTKGSHEEPRLILMEYRPKGAIRTLCFVGKGITFDTGGISIKPAPAMDEMKFDMCGGAAVIGAMDTVAALELPVNVIGVVPTCENMPGGGAIKPGDILTAYSGKRVEVLNTDAEGRLILGDALAYAIERYKPDAVVDLATLTGACVVALGHFATGAISNDATFQEQVVQAATRAGDPVWPLPNFAEYGEALVGKYGDLQNIGPREGGAITAGMFLKHFVGATPWVHLDIAGTAWGVKGVGHVPNDGATGVGVAILVDLASRS
jgi:leucyl aminopeptidase